MFNSPGLRHQHTLGQLLYRLYPVEERRGRDGDLLLGPCGVILSDDTLVVPDLLFLSRERRDILGKEYLEGPPDLVVEILSQWSGSLDRKLKRDLYAKHGVQNYWLVDPVERWVRAYELGAESLYELAVEAQNDESFSAAPFPDLVIQLADLWESPFGP